MSFSWTVAPVAIALLLVRFSYDRFQQRSLRTNVEQPARRLVTRRLSLGRSWASFRFSGTSLLLLVLTGCGTAPTDAVDPGPPVPPIVTQALEFHGGDVYERSTISMTISSLSGSFQISATREGGRFEYVVTGLVGQDQVERRVRLTNDTVQEWRDGVESRLDAEGERRARAHADARVFFPLLPYTLKGGDIHFEDLGLENWEGRDLRKVKVMFTPRSSNDADDTYMFWFDPGTGRVEQFGYAFDGGLRYRKAVAFNRVSGILFSDQENYAIDGGHVPVDTLSPEYIAENMELLSTVVLSDISVEPL